MTVSDMTGPEGEHDKRWPVDNDDDALRDAPAELDREAGQLDLQDDDPPLPWLQGDDEEFEESNSGQLVGLILLGLLAIVVIAGGVWWLTRQSADQTLVADGSVIAAPEGPYKQKPGDPGGKVFEGTGDTSFGISEGQKRPARLGEEEAPQPGFTPPVPAAKPAAKGAPAPAASAAAAPAQVAGVGVQVAAYSNQEQAEAGWTRLSGQYEALAGVKHRIVQGQADIGTVYRLQAVAPDAVAARALCQKLKSAGLNCQVKN